VARLKWQLVVAGAVLALAGPAGAADLPVRLSDADPRWRLAAVGKESAPGLTLEAVATHAGSADRLIFLSAPADAPDAADPDAFARRVAAAFTDFTCGPVSARRGTRAGFAGRAARFTLANAHGTLDCELFVFTDAGSRWGILYSKPQGAPESAETAFGLLLKNVPLPAGTYALKPFRTRNTPLTTFPISLQVSDRAGTTRVETIRITDVAKDSEAEAAGIRVGDEITAIDGRKVQEFPGGVGKDDELGRIFLNRRPGDRVTLLIKPAGDGKPFTVTLHTLWGEDAGEPFRPFDR